MKLVVERYFNSLNDLLDQTNYILTDWSTPQVELAAQCKQRVYERCLDVEKHQLNHCLAEQQRAYQANRNESFKAQMYLEHYMNQYMVLA